MPITLVIIFGPPAVGKMAVGMELARLTGYKLFHNHMTADAVMPVFPFESPSYTKLVLEQAKRLRRNATPLRMTEKRPQRNTAGSRQFLIEADTRYRMNTDGDFCYPDRHLRVDNTTLEPEEVARQVVNHFGLLPP